MTLAEFFGSEFLAVLSAPLSLWLCQLSVLLGARIYQIRGELFHWFGLEPARRRLIASVLGMWGLTTFAGLQRARATFGWISQKWSYELFAVWYLPIGMFGAALLMWWAASAVFGIRRGWYCWGLSMLAGILLAVGIGFFAF